MIILASRGSRPTGHGNHHTAEAAQTTEMDANPFFATKDGGWAIGCYSDESFRTGQGLVEASVRLFNAGAHPVIRPTNEIGSGYGQHRLDLDAGCTAAHEMLNLEGCFLLLVTSFNRLAAIVLMKPSREVGQGDRFSGLRANQNGVQLALGRMKALQADCQGVRTAHKMLILIVFERLPPRLRNTYDRTLLMPEIARFYGIIITMYFGDPSRHPVPHFHARYGEYQASFAIDPPAWLAGMLPRRPMQLVLAWAEIHQAELLTNWQRLINDESVQKIASLR